MLRAYWTADYGDAGVVTALLRAHDVHAFVFDAGMTQLDWFKSLAFGGYRVTVPAAQSAAARELLDGYRDGALAVPDAETDVPPCPRCAGTGIASDPRPRRAVFALLIAVQIVPIELAFPAAWAWIAGFALQFLPLAAAPLLGSRYRCAACGNAFGAAREPFATLAQSVAAAEASAPDSFAP